MDKQFQDFEHEDRHSLLSSKLGFPEGGCQSYRVRSSAVHYQREWAVLQRKECVCLKICGPLISFKDLTFENCDVFCIDLCREAVGCIEQG
jgi:hypothetical protein